MFLMILLCVSDLWRRFVHKFDTYPYVLFKLLDKTHEEFLDLWESFHAQLQARGCFFRRGICAPDLRFLLDLCWVHLKYVWQTLSMFTMFPCSTQSTLRGWNVRLFVGAQSFILFSSKTRGSLGFKLGIDNHNAVRFGVDWAFVCLVLEFLADAWLAGHSSLCREKRKQELGIPSDRQAVLRFRRAENPQFG